MHFTLHQASCQPCKGSGLLCSHCSHHGQQKHTIITPSCRQVCANFRQLHPWQAHLDSASIAASSLLANALTSGAAADGGQAMAGVGAHSSPRAACRPASLTAGLLALAGPIAAAHNGMMQWYGKQHKSSTPAPAVATSCLASSSPYNQGCSTTAAFLFEIGMQLPMSPSSAPNLGPT